MKKTFQTNPVELSDKATLTEQNHNPMETLHKTGTLASNPAMASTTAEDDTTDLLQNVLKTNHFGFEYVTISNAAGKSL
jgi:hypothetical protein